MAGYFILPAVVLVVLPANLKLQLWAPFTPFSFVSQSGLKKIKNVITKYYSMKDDDASEFVHPLGRRRKNAAALATSTTQTPAGTSERKTVHFGDVHVRTPSRRGEEEEVDGKVEWRDHRRHLGSFEDQRAMEKMTGKKTKIQRLKEMRRMRRAALRDPPPARRILQDPKGAWVLIVILIILTLLGVHFFCDTWIEALTLLTFVSIVTVATATIQ